MQTYNLLTGRVRQIAYVVFALLGAGLGSTQIVYSSLDMGQPQWLIAALAVYAYVGVTFGLTAGNNVQKDSRSDIDGSEPEVIPSDSVMAEPDVESTEDDQPVG